MSKPQLVQFVASDYLRKHPSHCKTHALQSPELPKKGTKRTPTVEARSFDRGTTYDRENPHLSLKILNSHSEDMSELGLHNVEALLHL